MTIAGDREFPPESEERGQAAIDCAGTTASVDSFIDGYGDFDGENDGRSNSSEDINIPYLDGVITSEDDDIFNDNQNN